MAEASDPTLRGTGPRTETLGSASSDQWVPESVPLDHGTTLGRYIVLQKLGEGGMGQVYAAYDPELDRRVAIKVMRFTSDEPESFSSRLRQEGRALARLRHPNVVTVFDVGVADRRLFIATELVDGLTVDQWLRQKQRPWKEVLDVFIDIGNGIAAAHREGLVHRDIKPSNMMVAEHGRALVLDFGIARDSDLSEGALVTLDALRRPELSTETEALTATGAAVGTPAFMAPEQRSSGTVGPAADLYSFCLSLHVALFDELPKDPSSEGRRPKATSSSPIQGRRNQEYNAAPLGLRRLVLSGLREDPGQRPESMAGFVTELQRFRHRGRRLRQRAAILTILGLIGAIFWLWRGSEAAGCDAVGDPFTQIWGASRSDRLKASFLDSDQPFAADVWRTFQAGLGVYRKSWTENARSWCLAARDGSLSSELFDLRTACLEQRLTEVDATLDLVESDPQRLLPRAVDMVDGLAPISTCFDIRALLAPVPPDSDPGSRQKLAELRRDQAEVRALWTAGDFEPALAASSSLVENARRLGYWPLIAEALFHRGAIEDARLDQTAADTLVDATLAAAAGNHNRLAAEAFIRLVRVAGLHLQDFELAATYAQQASSALLALGRPGDLAAQLDDQLGMNARHQGLYDEALLRLNKSLEWKTKHLGEQHPSVANTLLSLGNVYDDMNDHRAALQHLDRALDIQLRRLGPSHPAVAETYARLGTLSREQRDLKGALDYHSKAMDIHRRVHGPNSPPFAQSLTYLGELQALDGQFDDAESSFEQALAILGQTFGPEHGHLAVVYATMASAWTEAGRDQAAIEPYEKALTIYQQTFGAGHPQVGVLHFNLATVYLRLGRFETAADGFGRSVAIWSSALGESHALVANALTGQGDSLTRLGRQREAMPLLERAQSIDERLNANEIRDPKDRADTAFALARAGSQSGEPSPKVGQLAEQARRLYSERQTSSQRELEDLEIWWSTAFPAPESSADAVESGSQR